MKDLIDRQMALDALYEHEYSEYCPLDEVSTILNDLLPAQPEQQWIPCSERLPEEDGRYLITGKRGTVYSLEYEDGRWYGGIEPIAWMPLPAPYRKEGEQHG